MSAPASTDARVALLGRLVDHAPLFPPASMEMAEALTVDRQARGSAYVFMLARFVCPASRVAELGSEQRALSVVLDQEAPDDTRIEAVELRRPADLETLEGLAPEVYVELPIGDGLEDDLAALHRLDLRAKVRCGGVRIPTVPELARFVRACREAGVVFKATAGLHVPVRRGIEHGFLNLLAAAVFGFEEEALAETDSSSFRLHAGSFSWRGHAADADELHAVRRDLLATIGSCSFFEPVDELESLGMLPL